MSWWTHIRTNNPTPNFGIGPNHPLGFVKVFFCYYTDRYLWRCRFGCHCTSSTFTNYCINKFKSLCRNDYHITTYFRSYKDVWISTNTNYWYKTWSCWWISILVLSFSIIFFFIALPNGSQGWNLAYQWGNVNRFFKLILLFYLCLGFVLFWWNI